tara:strand:+ start:223 stop:702 length:480 start_codon:yes stop_codon:yes gene_type:complete
LKKRYDKVVTGTCKICGRSDLPTEMHHIISRGQINRASKVDLHHLAPGLIRAGLTLEEINEIEVEELRKLIINKLPSNIIEVCGGCHDLTVSSEIWRKNQKKREKRKVRNKRKWRRKKSAYPLEHQCVGTVRNGRRCRHKVELEGEYCKTHAYQKQKTT